MENRKSKVVAGVLAIFLGSLGIHHFYLGNTKKGVIALLVTILTCGIGGIVMEIIGIIDGINILTGKVTTDANGVPLDN